MQRVHTTDSYCRCGRQLLTKSCGCTLACSKCKNIPWTPRKRCSGCNCLISRHDSHDSTHCKKHRPCDTKGCTSFAYGLLRFCQEHAYLRCSVCAKRAIRWIIIYKAGHKYKTDVVRLQNNPQCEYDKCKMYRIPGSKLCIYHVRSDDIDDSYCTWWLPHIALSSESKAPGAQIDKIWPLCHTHAKCPWRDCGIYFDRISKDENIQIADKIVKKIYKYCETHRCHIPGEHGCDHSFQCPANWKHYMQQYMPSLLSIIPWDIVRLIRLCLL